MCMYWVGIVCMYWPWVFNVMVELMSMGCCVCGLSVCIVGVW